MGGAKPFTERALHPRAAPLVATPLICTKHNSNTVSIVRKTVVINVRNKRIKFHGLKYFRKEDGVS